MSTIELSVFEIDIAQTVVGRDIGAIVFDDRFETLDCVLFLALEEVSPTEAIDELDGFAFYLKSFLQGADSQVVVVTVAVHGTEVEVGVGILGIGADGFAESLCGLVVVTFVELDDSHDVEHTRRCRVLLLRPMNPGEGVGVVLVNAVDPSKGGHS